MPLADFHPAVRSWFESALGPPTAPQRRGWPAIRSGANVLIAAPTGSGKTLAAFLSAIDSLLRRGAGLPDATQVVYVSPLKALGNDVRKNLLGPLAAIREIDPSLPEVRVLVRTGDTPQRERAAMAKRPPHVLVTTPESLYILLTSASGREMLRTTTSVIVDEIHAVLGDKRGSHLALSLERLASLAGDATQRIGLSATQKPLAEVGRFLVGAGSECVLVDEGHLRDIDLSIEIPHAPLAAVCSNEQWAAVDARVAEIVLERKTTLVFVNTRRLAERVAARLGARLGEGTVACHHGSLAKDRRLDAEERLKTGRLRALVATASLELGIDVGDVDCVVQIGSVRSIATLLQRVGRSGHSLRKTPEGRVFPLTRDELVEAAAAIRAIRRGVLDRTPVPSAPLDILAQQIVAECVPETRDEDVLFERFRRAHPYRDLPREDFDAVVALHSTGRFALIHRDGVGRRLRATKRARITAITSGGAIPDVADYRVVLEPEGVLLGTLNEDFAVESSRGDVFQLGTASWRVERIEPGIVRVSAAPGQVPTVPFWLGEAPGRTEELAAEVSIVREEGGTSTMSGAAGSEIDEYMGTGRKQLGTVPTVRRLVLERFFDESGGQQLVLHAPFGSRVNRAFGLALRKRFCRGFGYELQAAANDEAILLSLGTAHSFELADVFDYLSPKSVRGLLEQALLASPIFESRWRWNLTRSLVLERTRNGKRVPAPLQRMRANDRLAEAFPQAAACFETLPPGDVPFPLDHPIVRQTVEDCLHEAMDIDGLVRVLEGLRDGTIERVAVDATEPSVFAQGILAAAPYAFLDDAPLEERRVQAVSMRRSLDPRTADAVGALDPAAIARVREEAWPVPANAEEVHEALLWMGFVTEDEGAPWREHLAALEAAGRVEFDRASGRWFATEAPRDAKSILRGRLEAVGPYFGSEPELLELERDGVAMRARFEGREGFCDRRLLARIHRYTIDRLRREIEPVTAARFTRFLGRWQHTDPEHRLDGPRGVAAALRQLAGREIRGTEWERTILPARVAGYRRDWLDQATLSGEFAFGRLFSSGAAAPRATPISFVPRDDLDTWLALAPPADPAAARGPAADVLAALAARGSMFPREIERATSLPPAFALAGLADLFALGLATADSFASVRALFAPPEKRRGAEAAGRWSLFRRETRPAPAPAPECFFFFAREALRRTGVVFRATYAEERSFPPWRDVVRALRTLEARGEVRGGRFVLGTDGEQYALPEALAMLREERRRATSGAAASSDGGSEDHVLGPA